MSNNYDNSPCLPDDFHAVDKATVKQTIVESSIVFSCDMGCFVAHHGTRYGKPILIVEHKNQQLDQLSGVWYVG